jgi:hypothetical protein
MDTLQNINPFKWSSKRFFALFPHICIQYGKAGIFSITI